MSNTIELTDEQWGAYQRGEPVTVQKKQKWEPEGGSYKIYPDGFVIEWSPTKEYPVFGMQYPTKEKAARARDLMRPIHRYIAYAMEHWPNYKVPPEGKPAYSAEYNAYERQWCVIYYKYYRNPWIPYGPEDKVKELVNKLNSGEVEF